MNFVVVLFLTGLNIKKKFSTILTMENNYEAPIKRQRMDEAVKKVNTVLVVSIKLFYKNHIFFNDNNV